MPSLGPATMFWTERRWNGRTAPRIIKSKPQPVVKPQPVNHKGDA